MICRNSYADASGYVERPFKSDELLKLIQSLISKDSYGKGDRRALENFDRRVANVARLEIRHQPVKVAHRQGGDLHPLHFPNGIFMARAILQRSDPATALKNLHELPVR